MPLLEIGVVVKPHGLGGEVVVHLLSNRPGRLVAGARFSVAPGSAGPTTPAELEVLATRPHQDRHLVTFAGVTTREGAESLRGALLEAEAVEDPDALFVHELIGAEVVDATGVVRGTVTGVEANPASDLLVVDERHLVPLRFVVEHAPGRVVVDAPEGLFE